MGATIRVKGVGDLAWTVVLAGCIAIAGFMILMPLVLLNTEYTVLSPALPSHKQNAESAIYLLMIVLVSPAALLLAWLAVSKIRSGPNCGCLPGLVSALVVPLGFGLYLVSHSTDLPWGRGVDPTLILGCAWAVLALAAVLAACRDREMPGLAKLETFERPLMAAAALAVVAAVLSVVKFEHVDLVALLVGLVAVGLATWAYASQRVPDLPRRWGIAFDVLCVLVVILAVPHLADGDPGTNGYGSAYINQIVQFHQGLFLGVASQILGGSTLLVDTVSQYGIGSIYLIAAFFEIAPAGLSTLAFFDGLLSGLVFGMAYGVLRMSGVNRVVAAVAMATAVITLAWGLTYPIGALLQHGAIRFGLPMVLIAPVVAGMRWPRTWPVMKWVALAVVGISSIWALEGFLYVTATVAGLIVMSTVWAEPGTRISHLLKACAAVIASWVTTHLLFVLVTLLASGSLPDWGLYLTYLREFLSGEVGDFTYDMTAWSPGLAVFAVYVISAFGIASLSIGRREFVLARKPAFYALASLTAYGLMLFSYFDNRSVEHVLPYVSLPALLVLAVWLGLILERANAAPKTLKVIAVATALSLAAVAVSSVWPAATERGKSSMLAFAIPGGKSLPDALDRTWNAPPVRPSSETGHQLIDEYFPDQDAVPVVTIPDLDIEMLVRSGRHNQLGINDASEAELGSRATHTGHSGTGRRARVRGPDDRGR